jgi:hypothetical protein
MKKYRPNKENIGISICGVLFILFSAHLFNKLQTKGYLLHRKLNSVIVAEGTGAYIEVFGLALIGLLIVLFVIWLEIKEYMAWKRNKSK